MSAIPLCAIAHFAGISLTKKAQKWAVDSSHERVMVYLRLDGDPQNQLRPVFWFRYD